jgi:hypothetical protein
MASSVPADPITLRSLKGGMNDQDPSTLLPDDQCVNAENTECFLSALGERRQGCEPVDMTGSTIPTQTYVVHLSQRFPTNDIRSPEYWGIGATPGVSTVWSRGTFANWVDVTPVDALLSAEPTVYEVQAQSLHLKHFFAYPSAVDRFHVWDGVTLRRTGLAQPAAAPTGANTGSGSYAATLRYYRVRFIRKVGGSIVLRSEPSVSLSITPSGSGTGVVVTRPALIGESETDWELEVSLDNATWYLLATNPIGTTTATDSAATTTYSSGTLSEVIGTYLLLPSARFLDVDQDRLLIAGHWTDPNKQSRIMWTPVFKDPGMGNDERLPLAVNNYVDLDNNQGGALTGFAMTTAGVGYAFKWSAIYSIVRTSDVTRAYDTVLLTHARGAIQGSVFPGVDSTGAACLYFIDPVFGPSRIGGGGLEMLRGFRKTWRRVNTSATKIIARGCYYPNKQQAHWWVAADGSNTPSLKLVLQVDSIIEGGTGSGQVGARGWSIATGRITQATAVGVLTENVIIDGLPSLSTRPYIGLPSPDGIQRCDTQDTDAGEPYVAKLRSHPYLTAGLMSNWGVMTGTLLATANAIKSVKINLIRDFGLETISKTISLAPVGTEDQVIKDIDDLAIAESTSVQFEFTDP